MGSQALFEGRVHLLKHFLGCPLDGGQHKGREGLLQRLVDCLRHCGLCETHRGKGGKGRGVRKDERPARQEVQ